MFLRRKHILSIVLVLTACLLVVYIHLGHQHIPTRSQHDDVLLRQRLSSTFPYDPNINLPKPIWQMWKYSPTQDEFATKFHKAESSWTTLYPEFEHHILTDTDVARLIARSYAKIHEFPEAFEALPLPVLKADFFRYLILLIEGGIYSDIDTTALKPFAKWVAVDVETYGMVIGIEADPDRPDWHDWYSRRIQFCQWTIVSKPGDPALVDLVASIAEEALERKTRPGAMKSVMEFRGLSIWTDTLFKFFNKPLPSHDGTPKSKNVTWERLANQIQPVKDGGVVVLPITSFSLGVGHMGSGSTSHPMAFVRDGFSRTWNHDKRRCAIEYERRQLIRLESAMDPGV